MVTDILVMDSNYFRGKCLQYRLKRDARCDYARTPRAAFEYISSKFRTGGRYDVIVLSADQVRFAQGIESIVGKFAPSECSGPDFVVMASGQSPERGRTALGQDLKCSGGVSRSVVEVSGLLAASRAALGR